ncbi:ribosomal biogenesis gar2 [Trichoderma cornu-damae]|uniref:Ribosomal biogenesis gar2 n=1 Tax=Trichoderma cornu-damae TaxID=654480 RepID=A0A9P8TT19_9HYPO|nr:ribosomal biogenesis gar2 [Trichoderma cornu-damae]
MAPVLRKRKAPNNNGATKTADKASKGKRKAAEQSSPVSQKKQKPTKKPVTIETKAPKSQKAKAKEGKKEDVIEEDVIEMEEDSDSDGQGDEENLQVLAANIDPEEEKGVSGEEFKPGQDVGKIPKVSKDVQKSIKASKEEPGVIYIGRIPHGFYEHEMKQYLSQFGPISRLRLSRNKKTGASKHFAFVEFAEASTAEIVAKTMDNYLLFGHILKCKILSKDQVHGDLFKGANRRFKKVPWNKMAGIQLEKPLTESAWETKVARERGNRAKKASKLKELGYDFEAPELKDVPAPAAIENGDEVKAIDAAPEVEAAPEEGKPDEEAKEAESAEKSSTPGKAKSGSVPKKATKAKVAKSTKSRKAKA